MLKDIPAPTPTIQPLPVPRGLEVDGPGASAKNTFSAADLMTANVNWDTLTTVTPRLGYAVNNWLLYRKVAGAWADIGVSASSPFFGTLIDLIVVPGPAHCRKSRCRCCLSKTRTKIGLPSFCVNADKEVGQVVEWRWWLSVGGTRRVGRLRHDASDARTTAVARTSLPNL